MLLDVLYNNPLIQEPASKATAMDKKEIDHNEFWYIKDNPLSKVGVFPYLGKQISPELEPDKIYNVLRPEEELNNEETLNSFKLVPIVDDHTMLGTKPGMKPAEEKGVHGVIGDDVYYKQGLIYGDLKIFSEKLKEEIENNKRELSMGYFCDYELKEGEYKNGVYLQTRIYQIYGRKRRASLWRIYLEKRQKSTLFHQYGQLQDGQTARQARRILRCVRTR